ncbi:arrestin domain-containing protein 3-like [Chanos chanos]|uniref:Arrestin domain-containing protein 3-like n=1 Tax=Chanos chanos TaxID=29144 RepID=A0A6J2W9Z1_CHACN|nr:arrestin domain-containing protein 3-like [Chanos chanos]
MTVKVKIEYDAINERNTFSSGDILTGRVILEVLKKTDFKSLTIKAKGKARVLWTEHYGQHTHITYYDKEKYFSQEQFLLNKKKHKDSNTLGPGRHVYPFTFQIPFQDMPSSYKGTCGKVRYTLTAKLSRSLHLPSKDKTKFNFISQADMNHRGLMAPQYGIKDKDVTFFASGNISMEISTERTGYTQGEGLVVKGEIVNSSTRKIVPKYILYQKQSFFAGGKRRVHTYDVLKEKGEPLPSSTRQTVSKVLTIPREITPTILNSRILKVEYRLKVILDVSFSKDPEMKLPIIILPSIGGSSMKELQIVSKVLTIPREITSTILNSRILMVEYRRKAAVHVSPHAPTLPPTTHGVKLRQDNATSKSSLQVAGRWVSL